MNDFLQNLRNNAKRYERNRKGYDNHNYQNNDRRQQGNCRTGNTQRKGNYTGDANLVKKALEEMTEAHKQVVTTNEELIALEKRKIAALEEISVSLQHLLPSQKPALPAVAQLVEESATVPAQDQACSKNNRSEIVRTIRKLRKEKMSYDKIASHLTAKGVPTLSGRGQWRGQTILRLSKETP